MELPQLLVILFVASCVNAVAAIVVMGILVTIIETAIGMWRTDLETEVLEALGRSNPNTSPELLTPAFVDAAFIRIHGAGTFKFLKNSGMYVGAVALGILAITFLGSFVIEGLVAFLLFL